MVELLEGVARADIFADRVDIVLGSGESAEAGAAEHGADAAAGGFFVGAADDIARLGDIDVAGKDAEIEGGEESGDGYADREECVAAGEVEKLGFEPGGMGFCSCNEGRRL